MIDYFLDTCIFLAHAYQCDPYNSECTEFFDQKHSRFTGKRVKSEVNGTLERRKKTYVSLARYLGQGGSAADFISRRRGMMNTNDERHFERILSLLETLKPHEALTYIRTFDGAARKVIDEAFKKIQYPLVDLRYNQVYEDKIFSVVGKRLDAKIFVDALYWGQGRSQAIFLTLDWTDFISLRAEIRQAIRQQKGAGSFARVPLKIRHINEI